MLGWIVTTIVCLAAGIVLLAYIVGIIGLIYIVCKGPSGTVPKDEPLWVRVPNSELVRLENAGCVSAFRIDDTYEWEIADEDERGEELNGDDDYECAINLRSVPRDKPLWIQVPEEDIDRLEIRGCETYFEPSGDGKFEFFVDLRTLPYGVPLCEE